MQTTFYLRACCALVHWYTAQTHNVLLARRWLCLTTDIRLPSIRTKQFTVNEFAASLREKIMGKKGWYVATYTPLKDTRNIIKLTHPSPWWRLDTNISSDPRITVGVSKEMDGSTWIHKCAGSKFMSNQMHSLRRLILISWSRTLKTRRIYAW